MNELDSLGALADHVIITRPTRPIPTSTDEKDRLNWLRENPMAPVSWAWARETAALTDRNYALPVFFKRLIRVAAPNRLRVVTARDVLTALTGVPHVDLLPSGEVLRWSDGRLWNSKRWVAPNKREARILAAAA
jgi:hypothetical protein